MHDELERCFAIFVYVWRLMEKLDTMPQIVQQLMRHKGHPSPYRGRGLARHIGIRMADYSLNPPRARNCSSQWMW